jgi:uncharacterized protein YndB with AHSA1/START domain
MANDGSLMVTASGDREIVLTRAFRAPRELVFLAWTTPRLLMRWFGVFDGWTLVECELDLCAGGAFRFVWRGPDETEMTLCGAYREIVVPARIVGEGSIARASSDSPPEPCEHPQVTTTTFAEEGGSTRVTVVVRYESSAVRDAALRSPMRRGIAAGYDNLASALESWRET